MLPVVSLLITLALISLYYWRKLLPYFQFPNHSWIERNLIKTVLFGTEKSRTNFIFQKFTGLMRKNESEGVFVLWIPAPLFVVFGEEAVKFFSNESSLIDKPHLYDLFKFMGETAIFVSSGKRFKHIKKIMMAAFYPNVIKNIVPVMNHHAACLVKTLDETNGEVTEKVEEIMKNHALRTFLEASMGIKADTEENKIKIKRLVDLFLRLLAIACHRLCSPWLLKDFMFKFSKLGKEYAALKTELDDIMKGMLEDIKENVLSRKDSEYFLEMDSDKNHSRQKSLGEVLIEQHLKDPTFDMEEVKNQVKGILTGGYDTTSNTLMWCFWLLGHHQDIQQKAYEEVMSVTNGDVEYEDGRNLIYLECILKETLRLYPSAPIYARTSNKDIIYENRTIPKGTSVAICLYHLHKNPTLYHNPESFIPERFAGDESDIKPWTYIPFAEGVRSCIGKHFAMLEMKIGLTHVLRKFKIISVDRPEDVKLTYEIILKSEKPLYMKFIPH